MRFGADNLRPEAVRFLPVENEYLEYLYNEGKKAAQKAGINKREVKWGIITPAFNERFAGKIDSSSPKIRPERSQSSLNTQFGRLQKRRAEAAQRTAEAAATNASVPGDDEQGQTEDDAGGEDAKESQAEGNEGGDASSNKRNYDEVPSSPGTPTKLPKRPKKAKAGKKNADNEDENDDTPHGGGDRKSDGSGKPSRRDRDGDGGNEGMRMKYDPVRESIR
jgi:hypothetical protein